MRETKPWSCTVWSPQSNALGVLDFHGPISSDQRSGPCSFRSKDGAKLGWRGLKGCGAGGAGARKALCAAHGLDELEVWKNGAKQAEEPSKLSQEAKEDAGHSGDMTDRHACHILSVVGCNSL